MKLFAEEATPAQFDLPRMIHQPSREYPDQLRDRSAKDAVQCIQKARIKHG